MPVNSLSPGFVIVTYTNGAITHKQVLPTKPSGSVTPGSEPSFETNGGGSTLMSTLVDAYVVLFKAFFHSAGEITQAEYWNQPTPASNPVWIYAHPIAVAGTAATANAADMQIMTTFRTNLGGIFRHVGMEPSGAFANNTVNPAPFGSGTVKSMADYLVGVNGWIYGRDGGKLVVPVKNITKTNDALRKRRLQL